MALELSDFEPLSQKNRPVTLAVQDFPKLPGGFGRATETEWKLEC